MPPALILDSLQPELAEGARMASVFHPIARVLARLTALGAKIRLLPAVFPQELSANAQREAREIEAIHAAAVAAQTEPT